MSSSGSDTDSNAVLKKAGELRANLPYAFHDKVAEAFYSEAAEVAERNLTSLGDSTRLLWERRLDWILTNKWTGIPCMVLLLAIVLWITIAGANVPSEYLSKFLVENGYSALKAMSKQLGLVWWLDGLLIDGMYLTCAWVVSVMLPPMAIFFPLFTILEDFGYLPRVAFNLDRLFHAVGAHGKQALTMTMGWGCNAAGVIATRIIDSPRERLIAIITNNFSLCNGRWPTQFMLATVFVGSLVSPAWAGIVASLSVLLVALLGVGFTLISSLFLSRTVLKGEASTFSLELPPYRPPRILRTLYTSVIDRTMLVLWRAVVFALPSGALLWLVGNVPFEGLPIASHIIQWLNPFGLFVGLNGIILLAYVLAIPANEIVVPTVLMLTVITAGVGQGGLPGGGVIFEAKSIESLRQILIEGGWNPRIAVCVMLFSLCHNPCSTTIYTIYKETKSVRWTVVSTLGPIGVGLVLCALVSGVWKAIASQL